MRTIIKKIEIPMMNEIDKLAWLYIQGKRLLGARSRNKDIYYIPGGKREKGESDREALIREIQEELSIDLQPETIAYAGSFQAQAHEKAEGVQVKLSCYFAEFTGEIRANAEIEEVIWLAYEDRQKCSPVTILVMDWLKSAGMIV